MTGEAQRRETGQAKGQTMSQVTVTINGRQFRMACEDGQEGHLMRLAGELDQRIDKLRGNFGEIGDARLTIMAALTVSDELADVSTRLKRVENELASLQEARITSAETEGNPGGDFGMPSTPRRTDRRPDRAAQPDRGRKRRGDGLRRCGASPPPPAPKHPRWSSRGLPKAGARNVSVASHRYSWPME